jgi:hypothetical protein
MDKNTQTGMEIVTLAEQDLPACTGNSGGSGPHLGTCAEFSADWRTTLPISCSARSAGSDWWEP